MSQAYLEAKLEALFIKLLDEKEIFHHKGKSDQLKGYPDRTVYAQEIYHVELKVGKEDGSYYKQTPTQKFWEVKITKSKGNYVLLEGEKAVRKFAKKLKNPK